MTMENNSFVITPQLLSLQRMLLLLVCISICVVEAILPQLALDIQTKDGKTSTTYYASNALFGKHPPMSLTNNPVLDIVLPFSEDPLLCNNSTGGRKFKTNSLALIPRGECSFETKVLHAQSMGASAALIYGTLASRYTLNKTASTQHVAEYSDIVWPVDRMDYDCTKGRALIPKQSLSFDPLTLPYNAAVNDPVLTGNGSHSLCLKNSPDQLHNCESKMCLLTGKILDEESQKSMMEACCAWDLHIWLYPDMNFANTTGDNNTIEVTIPAGYLKAEQATQVLQDVQQQQKQGTAVKAVLYTRWRPSYNSSAFLIWMLGSAVAAMAAYLTASDYHDAMYKFMKKNDRRRTPRTENRSESHKAVENQPTVQEEFLELTPLHALGFIISASSSLLILFYFKIYGVVKIFYALGCSTAVAQVILLPLTYKIMRQLSIRNVIVMQTNTEDFGDISLFEVVAHAIGYTLGLVWLFIAITAYKPETITFYWVMQDIFGACMCITFLKVIRLNSIRVASILLIVAFFYDIFFVFVTPLLFQGKSVMITVATSGGPPKADALWCEKYPTDKDCQGGNPMPMLFAVPKINDYMGGSSLLGLGDIVLPGLLLSFAARFDAAKSLLGILGGGRGANNSYNCPEQKFCHFCFLCKGGYFPPIVVAYAVGLGMANTAVYVMNMGQPALLYLVPCCLGTLVYIGWRRNELKDLWEGPRVLKAADDVVYGENSTAILGTASSPSHHLPLPTDDSEEALAVPSAADNAEGDLTMVSSNNKSTENH